MATSYGSCMFNSLRNYQTVLSGCPDLQFQLWHVNSSASLPFSPQEKSCTTWRSMTFLGHVRELGSKGKPSEGRKYNVIPCNGSCRSRKLGGTFCSNDKLLEAACGLLWETPRAAGLGHVHGFVAFTSRNSTRFHQQRAEEDPAQVWSIFNVAVFPGMRWYLTVAFMRSSRMANDAERLFMWFWATHRSSLVRCLFRSFAHFSTRLLVCLWLSFESSLYILNKSPLSDLWFSNIFSHDRACLSILLTESFESRSFEF